MESGFNMIYGYARVSTKGQAKDGNSLEAQEKALQEAGLKNSSAVIAFEYNQKGFEN